VYSGGTTHVISVTVPGFTAPKLATVYLPEGYDPNGSTTYRVVYFLHGVNNTHNSPNYNPIYGVFDQLIANNMIEPVILVRPDGSAPPYLGSFYTNSALYGPCEDWIYNYLVDYIDANYKTKVARNNRVIFGHSMGGYGSMKMAFKHTELYRAVASLSGPLDFTICLGLVPVLIAETGQQAPPYNFAPTNGLFSVYAFSMLGAFTPNLSNPPYYVNFMINSNGSINYPVFFQMKTHCAARLSLNISAADNLAIYFDCGYQDELGMMAFNNAFKDTLNVRNIPYHYENFNGTHWSKFFSDRVPIAMHFLDSVMNYPEDALSSLVNKIDGFNLEFGITNALKAKLNSALNYWSIDDYNGVCSSVQDFINFVKAQTGKKISEAQAVILLNDANSIRFALDCSTGSDFAVNVNTSPTNFELFQNYPNPFNPVTKIKYQLPISSKVKIAVYDLLGKELSVLVNDNLIPGNYEVEWNAVNYPSGVYFYKLTAGDYVQTKKMILVK
jgi:S-formylglutathione hydrolase FrmB